MKKPRITIYRYWTCYPARRSWRGRGLVELLRVKRPAEGGFGGEVYTQNLETGEVLQNTLSFRHIGEMTNRIAKDGFKKRTLAFRSIMAPKVKAERAKQCRVQSSSPESKIKSLQNLEKNWIRKSKLAATKLKKIRTKIKYYQKQIP